MRVDPFGLDLDWFAIDAHGRLGYFTSGGSDCVPAMCLSGDFPTAAIRGYFLGLKASGGCVAVTGRDGDDGDWRTMAAIGLHSFDWNMDRNGPYELIYRPGRALVASEISATIRDLLPVLEGCEFTSASVSFMAD